MPALGLTPHEAMGNGWVALGGHSPVKEPVPLYADSQDRFGVPANRVGKADAQRFLPAALMLCPVHPGLVEHSGEAGVCVFRLKNSLAVIP